MSPNQFVYRSTLPVSCSEAFEWHMKPGAFERLNPPWEPAEVVSTTGPIANGSRVTLRVPLGPMKVIWVAEHFDVIPDRQFCDRQIRGPFKTWIHTHSFIPLGDSSCVMEDRIEYELPFGRLGNLLGARFVRRQLERVFAYRHRVLRQDCSDRVSEFSSKLGID